MRRLIRAAAAVACVVAMMGADGGCQRTVPVTSDAPEEWGPPENPREAVMRVTEATGPYSLQTRIAKVGSKRGHWVREKIAGETYTQPVTYEAGTKWELIVHVIGHPDDMFVCEIVDGTMRDRSRAAGEVYCTLTTSQ